MDKKIQEKIERVYDMFESSFIHKTEELILHKKWNIYFRLSDITSEVEFDYKLLSYMSFYVAENHFNKSTSQYKWARNKICRWFRKDFTHEDLQRLYQRIGCGANKDIGIALINSGFEMSKLDCENT